jgi:putative acetyltransferase
VSAVAHPRLALRPMLPADVSLLVEIFRESVTELTADDYSEAQQEAWLAAADDEQDFAGRLGKQLTLIATLGGSPIGFISLAGADTIDMLYVHPTAVGQGAGAMLLDAIEKLAVSRGAHVLKVDASDTALGFFQKRGYMAKQRNSVALEGEWLANTSMEKTLQQQAEQEKRQ